MSDTGRSGPAWPLIVVLVVGAVSCADAPRVEGPDAASSHTAGSVVDVRGRRLSTSTPRSRVVSLVPSLTEVVVAVGGEKQLVGRTRFDVDPRIAGVRSMGGSVDPNVEAVLDARPDLVVTWADVDARALTEKLESFGLPVYAATIGTIADFERHTRALGMLLGRAAASDSLVRRVADGLAAAGAPPDGAEPPVVLFVAWPRPVMTSGRGTFVDELIRLVGARGAFEDLDEPWPTVSFEAVLERDPDLVLIASEGGGDDGTASRVARRIERDPLWRTLEAVREGRVHAVDADLFTRPGPRMALAASELARHVRALRERRP